MYIINGTIKAPAEMAESIRETLHGLGVREVDILSVSYETFVQESRLNWDCVFPEMWEKQQDVAYLRFSFPDSDAGRQAAYQVEFHLPQIPLNLRYDEVGGSANEP